ncbi:MAG: TlpA disulfide reductase family protein [Mariniphaga sp.]
MRSILQNPRMAALLGILLFTNVFGQSGIEIPKQEIPEEYEFTAKIGDKVPDFTLTLANGKKISSQDWKGKVVMLQFTASWCGICRKEIPYIQKDIWAKHKRNSDFLLFGIDRDEPVEKVKRYQKEMNISYPIAVDQDADVFGLFADKRAGVTRNVVIDRNGKIVFMTRLFKENEFKEMVKIIGLLLK